MEKLLNECMKLKCISLLSHIHVTEIHFLHPASYKQAKLTHAHTSPSDERGILEGKRGTSYDDGVAPSPGRGARILQQFTKNGNRPVEYGQSWVFSGPVTTDRKCTCVILNIYLPLDWDWCMCVFIVYSDGLDITYLTAITGAKPLKREQNVDRPTYTVSCMRHGQWHHPCSNSNCLMDLY